MSTHNLLANLYPLNQSHFKAFLDANFKLKNLKLASNAPLKDKNPIESPSDFDFSNAIIYATNTTMEDFLQPSEKTNHKNLAFTLIELKPNSSLRDFASQNRGNPKSTSHKKAELIRATRAINTAITSYNIIFFVSPTHLSIAFATRRFHAKRIIHTDIIQKITLIKDIDLAHPSHAHRKNLDQIAQIKPKEVDIYYSEILETLSISSLNKEFYKEIFALFAHFVENLTLPNTSDEQTKRDFVLRLLCRILFCKFLEKKSIINPNIWDSALSENYYHEVLEPLFFTTLNTPNESRNYDFLPEQITSLLSAIPYLNGGLFSPQDNDFFDTQNSNAHLHDLHIPNQSFSNLFALLDRYNFTLDEQSPSEQEVALDPELLGTVFESLLSQLFTDNKVEKLDKNTLRKATGSYYTPREIVRYMVRSAILAHLQTKLKGKVDSQFLENLVFESSPSLAKEPLPKSLGYGEGLIFDSPLLARGDSKSPPSLAHGDSKDSPSLARNTPPQPLPQGEGLSLISPSLAEGVRGWVDSPDSSSRGEAQAINADSSSRDFVKQNRGNPNSPESSLRENPQDSRGNPQTEPCHTERSEVSQNAITCHSDGAQATEESKNSTNNIVDSSLPAEAQNDKIIDCHESATFDKVADSRNDKQTTQLILAELNSIKILDPACGSGAFPMGILSEIIRIQSDLGDTRPHYERKLEILQECIYGIDIQPMATEIARLRCFLSLIIDENADNIKPLPNLEFKFISANSLIPLPKDNALQYDGYQNDMRELKSLREFYFNAHAESSLRDLPRSSRGNPKSCHTTTLSCHTEGEARSISNIQNRDISFSTKTQYDKEIDCHDSPRESRNDKKIPLPCGGGLGVGKINTNYQVKSKSAIQKAYMILRTKIATTIQAVQKQDFADNPILDYDPFNPHSVAQFFDSAYMFGVESFDIVIGNPPYIGEKGNRDIFTPIKNSSMKDFYQGKMDIFYFFFQIQYSYHL